MNYINLDFLHKKGLTIKRWLVLQLIHQKDSEAIRGLLQDEPKHLDWFEENKYIKFVKTPKDKFKSVRTDKKAKDLLQKCAIVNNSQEAEDLCDAIIEEYTVMGKPTGNRLNVLDCIIWFLTVTPYTTDEILESVVNYLHENSEYTKKLDNLFWTPPSKAFSVHKNLKDSTLYDLMSQIN